jgi:hypothetical protein
MQPSVQNLHGFETTSKVNNKSDVDAVNDLLKSIRD